ncbi:MAG TPA: amidohydrolase family protein, partial [Candidatus Baltobacteraceae bacterium]|nr:amidohydrolase family protein [Candidatus Baltobacteraceae bacterium]
MILRARIVLPVSQPPVENGAIAVSENKILAVGPWEDLKSDSDEKVFDLGEVVLLPGLVNAHCHLDYTDMAGQLSPPKTFTDWIPLIMGAKSAWTYSDYARSWLNGAKMLLRTGTTTVGDIEAVPDLLPEIWDAAPLRVVSFLEMTGIRSQRAAKDILSETIGKIDSHSHELSRAALSPHAPYSTSPELLKLTAESARRRKLRVATHIAESHDEFEMFTNARGKMFDWLARSHRDNSDCGLGSPVQHAARAGLLGENFLAIHVNLLARGDAALLRKTGAHVVHCPRSHDYFRHPPFQRERLTNAGVNIALGTDSLATTRKAGKQKPELNMFAEMRALSVAGKKISPVEILRMATVNGARALGMAGQTGELSKNAFADLIAIPFAGKTSEVHEAVLHHEGNV